MNRAVLILALASAVLADINLHNPRGGNNRLDEARRERNNANRLFDSQNNNRGGHNVGGLYYYVRSNLQIQWANQHTCADRNNHCEVILQYMCGDLVRDGTTTNTIPSNRKDCKNYKCATDLRFGMHEDYDYYHDCSTRERNMGLFTADRNLRGSRVTARFTRQNNNGQRRGYECPEERDYYPYWHPTPWKDIAVLTSKASRCPMYQRESENAKGRFKCVLPAELEKDNPNFRNPNHKEKCEKVRYPNNDNGTYAKWTKYPSHGLPAPDCRESEWSRDNHQGNTIGGQFLTYNWKVPDTPHEQCVLRIRYNITAGEYDGWDPRVNSALNGRRIYYNTKYNLSISDREARIRGYYYKNDPVVQIFPGVSKFKLRIQINTNQDARTFQDRTHTFAIRRRPRHLNMARIHNVNVRGKRGNIVQVFPTTEYDFVPNSLTMAEGEFVHFQWTGSNSNPNNNNGEGRAGSDRHNVLPMAGKCYAEGISLPNTYGHLGRNYPMNHKDAVFLGLGRDDLRYLAILEPQHFRGENQQLDDAGPYFDLGPRKVTGIGTYYYMSTRNNNFTNRSQKGKIIVTDSPTYEGMIGSNGGVLHFGRMESISIPRGALSGLTKYTVKVLSTDAGNSMIAEQGGSINVGAAYASKFYEVNPDSAVSTSFTMHIRVTETTNVAVFHSSKALGFRKWHELSTRVTSGSVAIFSASEGGVFVARTFKMLNFLPM